MRDAGVSIESLIQRGANADGGVLVAIVTHEGPERCVAQALEKLESSASVLGQPMWMHVLG
jgi:homoserine dehydrogenase